MLDQASVGVAAERVTERQLEQRRWTLAQLDEEQIRFVDAFPPTLELDLRGGRMLLACHPVPSSYDAILLPSTPEDEFRALLDGCDADVIAGGHVHLQFLRRHGDTLWVNPGNAGLSYHHEQDEDDFRFDPWAAYALLSTDPPGGLSVDLRRVPVSVEAIVARIEACGMPHAADNAWQWRSPGRATRAAG